MAPRCPPPAAARPGERTGKRAPLFFRETWKTAASEHAIAQDQVVNPNLELKLYGPSASELQAVGNADDPSNPPHVWTGLCTGPAAVALRDKDNYVDLTGLARIRWNESATAVSCRIRAMDPAPGAWTTINGMDIKVYGARSLA